MKVVFLAYTNRSGSTFFLNQLSKVPEICVCPEADILFDVLLVKSTETVTDLPLLLAQIDADIKWKSWRTPVKELVFKGKTHLDLFLQILALFQNQHFPNSKTIAFKHTKLLNIANDLQQFTNIYWLVLFRYPLAVFASQKTTISPTTKKAMSNNPLATADEWNILYNQAIEYNENNKVLLLQYEQLINSLDEEMNRVLYFLDSMVSWDGCKSNSGNVNEWLNTSYREIHLHINHEPRKESFEKWKAVLKGHEKSIIQRTMVRNTFYPIEEKVNYNLKTWLFYFWCKLDRRIKIIKKRASKIVLKNV